MEVRAELVAACPAATLWHHVERLERYPEWMTLVHQAVPLDDDLRGPAWSVELRTRVGPLARSKRLRMVRTTAVAERHAVFERAEIDGRRHSPWILEVRLEPAPARQETTQETGQETTHLEMRLQYLGSLWTGGVLQRILDDEIHRGRAALLRLVTDAPTR
jgi:hypothetical protein